jgi:hypothetical protein
MKTLITIITLLAASGFTNVNADDWYEQRQLQREVEAQRMAIERQRNEMERMRREMEYEAARQRSEQRAIFYSNR